MDSQGFREAAATAIDESESQAPSFDGVFAIQTMTQRTLTNTLIQSPATMTTLTIGMSCLPSSPATFANSCHPRPR